MSKADLNEMMAAVTSVAGEMEPEVLQDVAETLRQAGAPVTQVRAGDHDLAGLIRWHRARRAPVVVRTAAEQLAGMVDAVRAQVGADADAGIVDSMARDYLAERTPEWTIRDAYYDVRGLYEANVWWNNRKAS